MEIKLTKSHNILIKIGIIKRLLLMMMRTFILLLCTTVFSFNSEIGMSQTTVKIDADKEVSVDEVFDIIKSQTDYSFIYPQDLFKDMPKVHLKKGTIRMDKLINKSIASGKYNVVLTSDNTILIKEAKTVQQIQVTGKVTDEAGLPVAGATVLIKGTSRGVATDFDGSYNITVPNPENVLVFSALGFATQEITVGNQTTINVTLKEQVSQLDEVLLRGYYTTTKRESVGNSSKISASEIESQPVANPQQAMIGRMAGVQVTQRSGLPGDKLDVRVRGRNSLLGVNDPYYIIDGVPFPSSAVNPRGGSAGLPAGVNPFNSINPGDIESIEVLKDADATAIYGSLGANGVILITTKKGKVGEPRFNIDFSSGLGRISTRMDLLNTQQYLEMRVEGIENDGFGAFLENPAFDSFWPDLKAWDQNRYTDWQDELIGGSAEFLNATASVSGGTDRTTWFFSTSYNRQTTVYPNSEANNRFTGHVNLNHKSKDNKFNISVDATYGSDDIRQATFDLARIALPLAPNAPALYDENGELNWENNTWTNPLSELEKEFHNETDNFVSGLNLSYAPFKDLTIGARLGYTRVSTNATSTRPLSSLRPDFRANSTGSTSFSDGFIKTWIVEPTIEYKKALGKGELSALVGATIQKSKDNVLNIFAQGYTSDALLLNLQASPDIRVNQSSTSFYRYAAAYARLNYNYDSRYLINLTGRRDGSSRFGPDNRFANFGAVGAGWIFSNESFLKDNKILSFGKLRGSYGTTGSDRIGDYAYLDTYQTTQYPYLNQTGIIPSGQIVPDFAWEENKKLEGGLELGFFANRLNVDVSYFKNRSSNQLVGIPLPAFTGQSRITANWPATVENRGWEVELNGTILKTDNIDWSAGFNITFPENELVAYPEYESSPYTTRFAVGKSLGAFFGLQYAGVDPDTGDYTFVDQDGDGDTMGFPGDYLFLKEIAQKYFGGFQNSLKVNNFELSFLLQFVKQTGLRYSYDWANPGQFSNQPVEVINRWQQPGDITDIGKYTLVNSIPYFRYNESDAAVTDASFIRLTNARLAWSVPKSVFKNLNATVYLEGQNLFTITNYLGMNPENAPSRILPPLRVINTGLKLNF